MAWLLVCALEMYGRGVEPTMEQQEYQMVADLRQARCSDTAGRNDWREVYGYERWTAKGQESIEETKRRFRIREHPATLECPRSAFLPCQASKRVEVQCYFLIRQD
jgi:hypothetical protein